MKKVNLKGKLSLKKEAMSNLNKAHMERIQGGAWSKGNCTTGCTDGCTGTLSLKSAWNCTDADCTNNCDDCYKD
jgi:hypothetical protein